MATKKIVGCFRLRRLSRKFCLAVLAVIVLLLWTSSVLQVQHKDVGNKKIIETEKRIFDMLAPQLALHTVQFPRPAPAPPPASANSTQAPTTDLVITYVDGFEKTFRNDLKTFVQSAQNAKIKLLPLAIADTRFQHHDDLRILLRSISMYGKAFRKVFLVVSSPQQVPDWLNQENTRLSIVYHADIWYNMSELPTFNSLAIEANLHHIKDLAEMYVYLNDDISFLSEIAVTDFIQLDPANGTVNGLLVHPDRSVNLTRWTQKTIPVNDIHWINPALNVRDIIRESGVCKAHTAPLLGFDFIPAHTPPIFLKSVLAKAEEDPALRPAFEHTWSSRFRDGTEINTVHLFNAYAQCAFGLSASIANRGELLYVAIDMAIPDQAKYETAVMMLMGATKRLNMRPRPKFIVLNDHTGAGRKQTQFGVSYEKIVKRWREMVFPEKSEFEK